jgi:teichuronic acid exporter
MAETLKQQTKKGLYWSALKNFANQGMRFTFSIILARLLSPDAYGVIGMLSIFICIVSSFIDCGFSQALIAKADRTQKDFSTEFWFNIGVGVIGYLILFILSPYIAQFYNMPILSPILKVIGTGIIINSLCVVQDAQFAIRLDFKTPAKISITTQLASGIIGIIMAYYGCGVWALVFQQIGGNILNAILLWILAGWRPTMEFSKNSFNYLWGYGSKVLGSSLVQQIYDNLYPLVIGKFFDSRQLGLYSRANGFATLPSTNLSGILGGVTFPVLSKLNNDRVKLISVYRKMIKCTAFLVFPLMIGMSATSEPLVKVFLNEQWHECIIMLQIICCALIWQPLSFLQINVLKTIGRTDIILKLEIMKRSVGLITIFASIPFGVVGMCWGFVIFYIYCFTLNTMYTSKALKISLIQQIKDILPILLNAVLMGLIVYVCTQLLHISLLFILIISILIGIVYYFISANLFMKQLLYDTISIIKKN